MEDTAQSEENIKEAEKENMEDIAQSEDNIKEAEKENMKDTTQSEENIKEAEKDNMEDTTQSEENIKEAEKARDKVVCVDQDTLLRKIFQLRMPENQAIIYLISSFGSTFQDFLMSEDFNRMSRSSVLGHEVDLWPSITGFKFLSFDQSTQLPRQIGACSFGRVYLNEPLFRADDSFTHRHLCQLTSLDVEMEINEHYSEVLDIVDRLFVTIFDYLNVKCKRHLDAINEQFPFKPLKYLRRTLQLTFEEGIRMLKHAEIEIGPFEFLNAKLKRILSHLVLEKYETEFYILHRFPLAMQPFCTMPCNDNPHYSASFEVIMRGEVVLTGAQRIHTPELLRARAEACGVDVSKISAYLDIFENGVVPHGGFEVGQERAALLFCGFPNIHHTLFYQCLPGH